MKTGQHIEYSEDICDFRVCKFDSFQWVNSYFSESIQNSDLINILNIIIFYVNLVIYIFFCQYIMRNDTYNQLNSQNDCSNDKSNA